MQAIYSNKLIVPVLKRKHDTLRRFKAKSSISILYGLRHKCLFPSLPKKPSDEYGWADQDFCIYLIHQFDISSFKFATLNTKLKLSIKG